MKGRLLDVLLLNLETKLYIVTDYDPAFFMFPILLKVNKENNNKSPTKTVE